MAGGFGFDCPLFIDDQPGFVTSHGMKGEKGFPIATGFIANVIDPPKVLVAIPPSPLMPVFGVKGSEPMDFFPHGGQGAVLENDHVLPMVLTALFQDGPVGIQPIQKEQDR